MAKSESKPADHKPIDWRAIFASTAPLIFAGLLSLGGVWLGNHLQQQNSLVLQQKHDRIESRNRAYYKLMGLKLAWSQAIRTHSEAKALSEYYDARSRLNNQPADQLDARRENDRALALIPRMSDFQRETFEAIAEARVSFNPTPELEAAVDGIYRFETIIVNPPPTPQTVADLDAWKERQLKPADGILTKLLKQGYEDKFDRLLSELLRQLRERDSD